MAKFSVFILSVVLATKKKCKDHFSAPAAAASGATTTTTTTTTTTAAQAEGGSAAQCETLFLNHGSTADGKEACETTGHVVNKGADCAASACVKANDTEQCCKEPPLCSAKWEISTANTDDKEDCDAGKVVSTDAKCVTFPCTGDDNKTQCCVDPRRRQLKTACAADKKLQTEAECAGAECKAEECCKKETDAAKKDKKDGALSVGFAGFFVLL